jgi:hypothetical protein
MCGFQRHMMMLLLATAGMHCFMRYAGADAATMKPALLQRRNRIAAASSTSHPGAYVQSQTAMH